MLKLNILFYIINPTSPVKKRIDHTKIYRQYNYNATADSNK